jgi:hypothetical protein
MPETSTELRDRMGVYYGDRIMDAGPLKYLLSRGFTDYAGLLKPPTWPYELNQQEFESVKFLIDEYDYGWFGWEADSETSRE